MMTTGDGVPTTRRGKRMSLGLEDDILPYGRVGYEANKKT